jgi:hypothetical protein
LRVVPKLIAKCLTSRKAAKVQKFVVVVNVNNALRAGKDRVDQKSSLAVLGNTVLTIPVENHNDKTGLNTVTNAPHCKKITTSRTIQHC